MWSFSRTNKPKIFEFANFNKNTEPKNLVIKKMQAKIIKMLTSKQMLQSLPIVLTWVKACNTSENLPNVIRLII